MEPIPEQSSGTSREVIPALAHQNSNRSLNSLRSIRSTRSAKSLRSLKSNRSMTSIKVFKHDHLTYKTFFGFLHVKHAACLVGVAILLSVGLFLVYCMFNSMEQHRPHMKLFAVPSIIILIALLYLYVGIIKMKADLLYPIIVIQIATVFATIIAAVMIAISVFCNTKYVLRLFVDVDNQASRIYLRQSLVFASLLMALLMFQLWGLRAVCGCYRYFTDLSRFNVRHTNFV